MKLRTQVGMTLLEILIAMGIAIGTVTMIISINAAATEESVYSERSTAAVPLARFKVNEIEAKLLRDGFEDGTQNESGDFDDEGWPTIKWEAEIQAVEEFDAAALADINNRCLGGMLDIAEEQSGEEVDDTARSQAESRATQAAMQFMPLVQGIFEKSLRKIKLTVYWNNFGGVPKNAEEADEDFTVELYIFNAVAFQDSITPLKAMLGVK